MNHYTRSDGVSDFLSVQRTIKPKRDPLREARGIARAIRYGVAFWGALLVWWLCAR